MLERRRSSDFRAEEEEARRMAEQIMNPASAIKKPPNLKLLRTESFPSDQTQGMSESASSTPRSPGSSSAGEHDNPPLSCPNGSNLIGQEWFYRKIVQHVFSESRDTKFVLM